MHQDGALREIPIAAVLALSGHAVMARAGLARGVSRAWANHGAVGWTASDADRGAQLTVLGPARAAARLLADVAAQVGTPLRATVPRAARAELGRFGLTLVDGGDWDLRWATAPPRCAATGPGVARVLPPDRAADIEQVLAAASPGASARPGDPKVRRWMGCGEPLLAVAADTSPSAQVGHLSSVATRPEARGRGLGAAVTAALTRLLFAEGAEVVTLGLYADNEVAGRLYARLGFTGRSERAGGTLLPLAGAPAATAGVIGGAGC